MKRSFDIAVLGGGLAGLTSAIQLAKKGHKVVLFEKNAFPFHKVCGEYISMESWNFLEQVGVRLSEMDLPKISRFNLTTRKRKMSVKLPLGGFGISRYSLDKKLFELAKDAGVKALDNTKVKSVKYVDDTDGFEIETSTEVYMAKVVIGAHGKRSNIDKELNRKFIQNPKPLNQNYVGIKYHVEADLPDDLIELHIFKDGYCGISKIDNGRFCLCYLTLAKNLSDFKGDVTLMEKEVLSQNPILKDYLLRFPSLYEKPLAISQIEFGKKELVANHVLMAGDAAGMITPLTGNGMSIALHSSKLLAYEVHLFLSGEASRDEMELNYEIAWKNTFAKRIWVGRTFHKMFYNQGNVNLTAATIGKIPWLSQQLIKLTHGESF